MGEHIRKIVKKTELGWSCLCATLEEASLASFLLIYLYLLQPNPQYAARRATGEQVIF